jgi:hypothetical protein
MSRWFPIRVLSIALGSSQTAPGTPSPAVASTKDRGTDERLNILQAIKPHLTDLFQLARPEEVCFVSFGSTTGGKRSDPPWDCLNMLQRLRRSVVVRSAGEYRDGMYVDKVTGQAGV